MTTNSHTNQRVEVIEQAAQTLRRLLGLNLDPPYDITVDHRRGELIVGSTSTVVRLDNLIDQIRAAPPCRHQQLIDEFIEAALAASSLLHTIRLADWDTIKPRLRVRLRPDSTGRPSDIAAEEQPKLQVVVDLGGAVITPPAHLLTAWDVPLETVAATALANTLNPAPEAT